MLVLTAVLFSISMLLFLLSFYTQKREGKQLQEEEQHSLQLMGEVYQLQSKVSRLEEELLIYPEAEPEKKRSSLQQLTISANLKYEQGFSVEQIAKDMQLHKDEVIRLLPDDLRERL